MNELPISAASLFTLDEFTAAYEVFTRNQPEARTLAEMTMKASGGIVYEKDDLLFSVMATLSDHCAIRVGRLRGQSPAEALAGRDEFLRTHGEPSSWEVTRVREDDPGGGE